MASISRSELNQLLQKLLLSGMSSDVFEFSEDVTTAIYKYALPLRVVHKSSDFYFEVRYDSIGFSMPEEFVATCFPGSTPDEEPSYFRDWPHLIEHFGHWIDSVQKEVSEPDPWTLLRQGSILADQVPSGVEFTTFDEEELIRVRKLLDDIREFLIAEAQPTEDQLKLIDEKLSYLEESAKRQTKQDWAHTAIGVMFTIAIGLAMAPEQANKLFQLTSEFLKTVFFKLLTSSV